MNYIVCIKYRLFLSFGKPIPGDFLCLYDPAQFFFHFIFHFVLYLAYKYVTTQCIVFKKPMVTVIIKKYTLNSYIKTFIKL